MSRANPFLRDSVETASPGRLLVMLYDRLDLDLGRAERACTDHDVEAAHDALVHAQEIVLELRATLDPEAWPHAEHLDRVYAFLLDELCDANTMKDTRKVAACRRVIAPLHAAWREAAGIVAPPAVQRILA